MSRLREVVRFRARVLAPGRAPQARPVAFGLVVAGLALGTMALTGLLSHTFLWGFCLASLGLGLMPLLGGGMRWRDVEVEAREGSLRMFGVWGARRLLARKVQALSTASTPDGVVVAVGTSQNRPPMLLRVGDLHEADAVCDALAVGNRGLGTLTWSFGGTVDSWPRQLLAAALAACSVAAPLLYGLGLQQGVEGVGMLLFALAACQIVLIARDEQAPQIKLHSSGVDLSKARCGWGLVPYHCIDEVSRTTDGIELRLSPPHPTILVPTGRGGVLSEAEQEHLMAQIRSASLRAKGEGRHVRVADDMLDDLRRGVEPTVQWLQRLEAQASALRSGAYRGEGHNVSELWEALEDHDAAPELRVAAARVLVRVQPDEAAARVAVLASEQRDKSAREAFELALEEQDMDELARRLDRCGLWAMRGGSPD